MTDKAILKEGYSYGTYNLGELPTAVIVQQLRTPDGTIHKRSKSVQRGHEWDIPAHEYFVEKCPDAFESTADYEIINGRHPLFEDKTAGDCWIRIFTGMQFRAFRK